jgi:hypothetical protein
MQATDTSEMSINVCEIKWGYFTVSIVTSGLHYALLLGEGKETCTVRSYMICTFY